YYSSPQDTVTLFKDASNYAVGQVTNVNGTSVTFTIVYFTGTVATGNPVTGYTLGKSDPVPGTYYTYNSTGTQKRLDWYNADGTVNTGGNFYKECTALLTAGSNVFTLVNVSSLGTSDQQNYANWAKFYRTRISALKSASSVAFANVPDGKYRIGYSAI